LQLVNKGVILYLRSSGLLSLKIRDFCINQGLNIWLQVVACGCDVVWATHLVVVSSCGRHACGWMFR